MAEIALDKVAKRFPGGNLAVKETSFTIGDGEFFVLVGPSGCGKSTLLNMIVGLESVSAGEIRMDGRVINDLDPKDRNMAMVFQSYAIYPHMSVRDNLAFPLKIAKRPREEIDRRVAHAADMLELGELLERKPRALSGGQRQRVAMGRAMVREPAVYLLDEPLSNLDARLRVQMRSELARLQRRLATTTIYVTHDQTEAMSLGDRVAVLRRGEVQQIGAPRDLYMMPHNLFVAGFIGSPPMNFLPGRCEGKSLTVAGTTLLLPARVRERLAGRERVILGIRPEAIQLTPCGDEGLSFRTRADAVEWLGADLNVHVTLSGDVRWLRRVLPADVPLEARHGEDCALIARVEGEASVQEGDSLALGVAAHAVHLFDAGNGQRLGMAAAPEDGS